MLRLLILLVFLFPLAARAEWMPADAYRLDIRAYGAIPDDGIDDHAAIQAAIRAYPNRDTTVVLPPGEWFSSAPLEWRTASGSWFARVTLQLEDGAVLRLPPGSPGFGDPAAPKSFIQTGSINNSGVEAFQNNVIGGTIDCRGNPGAYCLNFLANNQGSVRDVELLGDGPACLYLGKAFPGPALVERVRTIGCDVGYQLSHPQYSITFLDVEAFDYRLHAMRINGNAAVIDGFTASSPTGNPISAVTSGAAYIMLSRATLSCGAASRSAIEVHAATSYLLADVTTSGCAGALKDGTTVHAEPAIAELASESFTTHGATPSLLNLPHRRAPAPYHTTDPAAWVNPLHYGAGNGEGGEVVDDVAGLQAAMNACLTDPAKSIVYYPRRVNGDRGRWTLRGGSINVPACVRRIIMDGQEHNIVSAEYQASGACVYRVADGTAEDHPLEIEYFRRQGGSNVHPGRYFCVTTRRDVTIRRSTSITVEASGPGTLYLLDNIGSFTATGGREVYYWQHNSESASPPVGTITASGLGTRVRGFGFKTENNFDAGLCTAGAQCELLGTFNMPCVGTAGQPVTSSGYTAVDADLLVSGVQYCAGTITDTKLWPIALRETRAGATEEIPSSALVNAGGNKRIFPLYRAKGPSCLQ